MSSGRAGAARAHAWSPRCERARQVSSEQSFQPSCLALACSEIRRTLPWYTASHFPTLLERLRARGSELTLTLTGGREHAVFASRGGRSMGSMRAHAEAVVSADRGLARAHCELLRACTHAVRVCSCEAAHFRRPLALHVPWRTH